MIPGKFGDTLTDRLEQAGIEGGQVTPGLLKKTIADVFRENGFKPQQQGQDVQAAQQGQDGEPEVWWTYHCYDGGFHRLKKGFKFPKVNVKIAWLAALE